MNGHFNKKYKIFVSLSVKEAGDGKWMEKYHSGAKTDNNLRFGLETAEWKRNVMKINEGDCGVGGWKWYKIRRGKRTNGTNDADIY